MSTKQKSLARRVLASVGAAALGVAGVAAVATTAAADPVPEGPGTGTGTETGSITVHKHWSAEGSTAGNPAGKPLEGVEFTLQEVYYDGESIDLTTAEGWVLAEEVFDGTAPNLPGDAYRLEDRGTEDTAADGSATWADLSLGIYLVTETGSGENLVEKPAAPFWVAVPMPTDGKWEYDVVAYPKNEPGKYTVTKEISGAPAVIEEDSELKWTVTVDVPATPLPYVSFTINDTVGAGHEFVSWDSISVGETELGSGADYTVADNVVTFTRAGLDALNAIAYGDGDGDGEATTVTAVITTVVTEVPMDGVFVNDVTVKINSVRGEGKGRTNYGQLLLQKVGETEDIVLQGAQFKLYDAAPSAAGVPQGNLVASGTTNADGQILWTVWVGDGDVTKKDFWLLETVAPEGYVLPANPWYKFGSPVKGATGDGGREDPSVVK